MGLLSKIFYPIFRRNSSFIAFVVVGGLAIDPVFNKSTAYVFNDVINKGVSKNKLCFMNSICCV